jgi:hypothetical protein
MNRVERRSPDRVSARRYLLGQVAESHRGSLEERLFLDDAFFEMFLLEEEDLVDAYVRNELSALERKRFEHRILASPALAARIGFARELLAASAG